MHKRRLHCTKGFFFTIMALLIIFVLNIRKTSLCLTENNLYGYPGNFTHKKHENVLNRYLNIVGIRWETFLLTIEIGYI
jgi:hypothetical protein